MKKGKMWTGDQMWADIPMAERGEVEGQVIGHPENRREFCDKLSSIIRKNAPPEWVLLGCAEHDGACRVRLCISQEVVCLWVDFLEDSQWLFGTLHHFLSRGFHLPFRYDMSDDSLRRFLVIRFAHDGKSRVGKVTVSKFVKNGFKKFIEQKDKGTARIFPVITFEMRRHPQSS